MLTLSTGAKVYLACKPVSMCKGFDGLAALTCELFDADPFSGHLFLLRGKSANCFKPIYWNGSGMCLFTKRPKRGRFVSYGLHQCCRRAPGLTCAGVIRYEPRSVEARERLVKSGGALVSHGWLAAMIQAQPFAFCLFDRPELQHVLASDDATRAIARVIVHVEEAQRRSREEARSLRRLPDKRPPFSRSRRPESR